jgi:Tol biopolymer transport system component
MAKDADERWQTASDIVRELRWIAESSKRIVSPALIAAGSQGVLASVRIAWSVAAVLFVAALASTVFYLGQTVPEPPVTKLQLLPPEGSSFGALAVSPDGRRVAFTAADASGKTHMWIRPLNSTVAQQLPGTDGASYPFWSPDSRFIGFFADSRLKKIEASGGSLQTICDLINDRGGARGGTWSRDGTILFAVEPFGPEPIYQVSAAGGDPKPVPLAALEPSAQKNHHHWPSFLPDGRHFLYFTADNTSPERTGIYLASLDSSDARLLMKAETNAAYAVDSPGASSPGGHARGRRSSTSALTTC